MTLKILLDQIIFRTYKKREIFIYLFIFGCVGSLLLHAGPPSCGEGGSLLVVVCGLLTGVASVGVEHGL